MLALTELRARADRNRFLLQAAFLAQKQQAVGINAAAKKTPEGLGGGKLWLITAK